MKLLSIILLSALITSAQAPFPGGGSNGNASGGSSAITSVNGISSGAVTIPPSLVNSAILFVSQSGSDSNNCTTWYAPCASIGGAIGKLPINGTLGSGGNSYGTIIVNPNAASTPYQGPTTTPWQWNQQISLICAGSSGTTNAQDGSCTVKAQGNVGILSSTSDYETSGFAHYLTIKGFTFDGNAGSEDLVREVGGGVNNVYSNVVFQNTTGHGIYLQRQMINFACEHCAFFDTTGVGGATYLNDTSGLNQINYSDIQVDRCGTNSCFYINQSADNASTNNWNFRGIKTEYLNSTAGTMPYIVRLLPYGSSGGNSFNINIDGSWGINTATGGGIAFAYEDNASGVGGRWHLQNVYASGYTYAFQSAKTGQHSLKNFVVNANYSDPSQSYNATADVEGNTGTFTDTITAATASISNNLIAGGNGSFGHSGGGTSTATPSYINLGDTYSSTPGANPKIRMYYDSTIVFGFGISSSQQEAIAPAGDIPMAFYVGGTKVAQVNPNGTLLETLFTPSSSSAACIAGTFADDANYHYVCTATNTWKRAALSTF